MQLMSHQPANLSGGGVTHQTGDATNVQVRKEVRFEGCASLQGTVSDDNMEYPPPLVSTDESSSSND